MGAAAWPWPRGHRQGHLDLPSSHPGPEAGARNNSQSHLPRGCISPNLTHTCEAEDSRAGTSQKPGTGGRLERPGCWAQTPPNCWSGSQPGTLAPQASAQQARAKYDQIQKQTQENRHTRHPQVKGHQKHQHRRSTRPHQAWRPEAEGAGGRISHFRYNRKSQQRGQTDGRRGRACGRSRLGFFFFFFSLF